MLAKGFVPGIMFETLFEDGLYFRLAAHSNAMAKKLREGFCKLNVELVGTGKTNQIFLDGFICKEPIYRKTPLGREIADLLLAVNRPYGKSDYIPCICWGRNARYASGFAVGERCAVWGRIQSREYMKKIDDDRTERRVAYEVSVSKLETSERDQEEQEMQVYSTSC